MSTQYTKEQFSDFNEQLFKEVYHAHYKLKMSMYIHNKFVADVTQGLRTDAVV